MLHVSLYPLWGIDFAGSLIMLVLSSLCMRKVMILYKRDREDALNTYLMWLIAALFAFCVFRSAGHLVKHLLLFTGHPDIWTRIAPLSGGLNTVTFVVIFAVTLFFRNVLVFMNRMTSDRAKIETTSRQLLSLNQDIESVVSDRTRAEMALNLAHEIRNPVMIIGGMLRRLNRADSDGSLPGEGYRREIKQQIEQLELLVAKFEKMQLASREHFKTLDLNALLQDAVEVVRPEAENKGIRISFQASAAMLHFQGNQQYLKAALLHLLRNGIEACSAGDQIIIMTELTPGGVQARIEDNGPGIPKHVLQHIFEPFYSTRDGATGLGLPYVRQIINEHRGEIRVTSDRGKGTVVELLLPGHLFKLRRKESIGK
jgi:signal transduction histidine kinase